jgi:signal transduction histidine kinase
LLANTNITGDLAVSGNISLSGNLTGLGTLTFGDQTIDTVTINTDFTQSIIPGDDLTYAMGADAGDSTARRWSQAHAPDWTYITDGAWPGSGLRPQSVVVSDQLRLDGGINKISAIQSNDDVLLSPDTGITRIELGDYKLQLATSSTRELNQIAQALNHLAAVLTEQIAKQRELLHRLQDVQEEERRKLAHELHDEFGQLLTALQVDASYVLKQSAHQPELLACAQAMYDNSSSILSQLKNLLAQLRPYGLQGDEEHDIALEQALRDLVRQRQSRGDAALTCNLSVNLKSAVVPQRLAVAVYRIAQEALTNVMRHAQAKQVDIQVSVDTDSNQLCLRVADDGVGLPEPSTTESQTQTQTQNQASRGLGLVGMRERILANQGTLQFITTQPHGLIVEAIFPLGLVEGQAKHD